MDPLATVELTDEGVEVRSVSPEVRSVADTVELLPLQGMLGLELPGPRQSTQLKEIWDFFAEGAQGTGDALYKIKQTEMKMSPPRLGETRLTKLYNYVKLQGRTKDIEAQIAAL